ncbi:Zn-ribbon domain-containing OB-fold protein [Bradyrhizobium xenonodulans]|uniref:Zn-ribbon domain-containing OB-fold protein n=1 Tax=Bradyrhizobium xenonodulans TaxID=2736875 RepID=A0ABY7MI83_9BRAD|nr:Zn-ribbon domain-containing OB-fold protein [Bradyrhizobium xenonodulans]WBL77894.1 Zn-ribbon domain-containing OB-fold protein [Bradyrhizobium xenonodulans]
MNGTDFIAHSPETKPFWDAAARGRFVLPRCRQCDRTHWYPRGICPHCLSKALDWQESPGEGEIHSFSVNRMGDQPYVLAYVALTKGPIMLTNIVDADPDTLSIGAKVKVVFKPSPEQAPVPLFVLR